MDESDSSLNSGKAAMKKVFEPAVAFSMSCIFSLAPVTSRSADSGWNEYRAEKPSYSRASVRETSDILRTFPGMWEKQLGSRGQWSPVRFRGCDFGQSAVFWNGFEITDPWTGYPDLSLIPDAWIDSLKVYPALSPLPVRPIGAVVDMASDRGTRKRPVTRINYDKDGNGYGRTFIEFSRPFSTRLDLGFGLAFRKYGNEGFSPGSDDETMHGQVNYRIAKEWKLAYRILRDKSNLDLPFSIYVPGDTLLQILPRFDRRQTRHFVNVSGAFLETEFRIDRASFAYGLERCPGVEANHTELLLSQSAVAGKLPLAWGVRIKWEDFSTPVIGRETSRTAHALLGTRIPFFRIFQTDVQAHVHSSTNRGVDFLGSGQVSWRPVDTFSGWISLFQGIRDPSTGERTGWFFSPFPPLTPNDWLSSLSQVDPAPNPSLHSERSFNFETGFEARLNPLVETTIRLHGRKVENLIVRSESGKFINTDGNRFWGAESSIRLGPFRNFSADIALNYLKSQDDARQNLFDRPNFWGNGDLSWTGSFFSGDLLPTLSADIRTSSEFWNVLSRPDAFATELLPFQYLVDVKLSAVIMKKAAFSFAYENCLDGRVEWVAGHPVPSRLFVFGFSWELLD
jgi:hypothetical protein